MKWQNRFHTSPRHRILRSCSSLGQGQWDDSCPKLKDPCIMIVKSFINIENKIGERMQPCFTPVSMSNQSVNSSLTLTQLETFLYSPLRRERNWPFIPNWCCSFSQSKSLLTESKAFLKSMNTACVSNPMSFLLCTRSWQLLPDLKPFCSSANKSCISRCSHSLVFITQEQRILGTTDCNEMPL